MDYSFSRVDRGQFEFGDGDVDSIKIRTGDALVWFGLERKRRKKRAGGDVQRRSENG